MCEGKDWYDVNWTYITETDMEWPTTYRRQHSKYHAAARQLLEKTPVTTGEYHCVLPIDISAQKRNPSQLQRAWKRLSTADELWDSAHEFASFHLPYLVARSGWTKSINVGGHGRQRLRSGRHHDDVWGRSPPTPGPRSRFLGKDRAVPSDSSRLNSISNVPRAWRIVKNTFFTQKKLNQWHFYDRYTSRWRFLAWAVEGKALLPEHSAVVSVNTVP
jgi:hypothetical protein